MHPEDSHYFLTSYHLDIELKIADLTIKSIIIVLIAIAVIVRIVVDLQLITIVITASACVSSDLSSSAELLLNVLGGFDTTGVDRTPLYHHHRGCAGAKFAI